MLLLVEFNNNSCKVYRLQENVSMKWLLQTIRTYLNGHIRSLRILDSDDVEYTSEPLTVEQFIHLLKHGTPHHKQLA